MKSFIVASSDNGKHVIRASILAYEMLTPAMLQKALKHKDIRVNGKKIASDITVNEGDEVEIWLPDECFVQAPKKDHIAGTKNGDGFAPYKIVFESDDLLLVNKRQGLPVHSGKGVNGECLIDIIRKNQHNPTIDLCHRIDMNTGGLVLLAKNKASLEDAIKLFKGNSITKRYRCLVRGVPTLGDPCICADETIMKEVSAFLEKPGNGNVFIHDAFQPGDLPITSRYRILHTYAHKGPEGEDVSDIEVELVTGRTHQIRAQFAHMGHPILGDGNYGRNSYNFFFKNTHDGHHIRYQQLFASTLQFRDIPIDNRHSRLNGRTFSIEPLYDVAL